MTKCLTKEARLTYANALVLTIAMRGRHFFAHNGSVGQFELAENGRVWFRDARTKKAIYTHTNGRWRGFTEGGTLRSLVQELKDYIVHGLPLSKGKLGPWPDWICDGDLWGYGKDMEQIRQVARAFGMLRHKEEDAEHD